MIKFSSSIINVFFLALFQLAADEPKREDLSMLIPLQIDLDSDHRVPCSPHHRADNLELSTSMGGSMSRRNLETIVEAIRHLEGETDIRLQEQKATTQCLEASENVIQQRLYVPHSEDSEEHSCITSDQDERSESSGRDSPSAHHYVQLQSAKNYQPVHPASAKLTSSKVVVTSSSYSEKYPAVTNVLQGNAPQLQMYCRPGVIVQKS